MTKLILFRGLPGAGKTTLATLLCDQVFAADDFFTDNEGNYTFYPSGLEQAHKECQVNTEAAIINSLDYTSHTIGVTNTFTTEEELRPYLELAAKYNLVCFSVIVENRHGSTSVHNVPSETLVKMNNRFQVKL